MCRLLFQPRTNTPDSTNDQSLFFPSHVGMLIEKKQHLLLVAVQRHFVARHFCLRVLKEMRLSKLKVLSQSDFRALLALEDHTQTTVRPTLPKAQHQVRSRIH